MSICMIGELNFFLGLQIKQTSNGTMIHQQKYVKELIKRFGMGLAKPIDTSISPSTRLVMDDGSPSVEEKLYMGMIGSLLYLTDEHCVLRRVCMCCLMRLTL